MQKSITSKFKFAGLLAGMILVAQPLVIVNQAQAAEYNHFTSDNWRWELRRGPGYDYKIQRWLNAGTPIKVLETGNTDWSLVEYKANGKTYSGWIHKNAIQSDAPAAVKLEEASQRLNNAERKLKKIETDYQELRDNHKNLSLQSEQLKQEKYELSQEFDHLKRISTQAIEIDNQNREMRNMIKELESQNVILKQQVSQAEDAEKRQWFLFGAGVLLLGLIVGRIFRMPKRRSGWDKI